MSEWLSSELRMHKDWQRGVGPTQMRAASTACMEVLHLAEKASCSPGC